MTNKSKLDESFEHIMDELPDHLVKIIEEVSSDLEKCDYKSAVNKLLALTIINSYNNHNIGYAAECAHDMGQALELKVYELTRSNDNLANLVAKQIDEEWKDGRPKTH